MTEFRRIVSVNRWSLTVAISAFCLLGAYLIGPHHHVTAILSWLGLALAFAGFLIVGRLRLLGEDMPDSIRGIDIFANLAWLMFVVMLIFKGDVLQLGVSPQHANYPGGSGGIRVREVSDIFRTHWREAGRDASQVDVDQVLRSADIQSWEHIDIEPIERDEVLIHYSDETEAHIWRFMLTDIEGLNGEWLEPVPWD